MPRHRILSVDWAAPSTPRDVAHPVAVTVGSGADPNRPAQTLPIEQVVAAIQAGEEFYTRRPGAKGDGSVHAFDCRMCGRPAIRSGPDAGDENRLERLPRLARP